MQPDHADTPVQEARTTTAEVFVGFDSAWTDSVKAPGAVCSLTFRGEEMSFKPPHLARFSDAARFIEEAAGAQDFLLVALDQPTRVPNASGARAVERVAGSVVNKLKGGVQPARREGGGDGMFGDAAPVWPFLAQLHAVEDPILARRAKTGRFLIEVFPALALPSMIPSIWSRGRAAKYNPAATRYQPEDWPLVCDGAARFANGLGVAAVAQWLVAASTEQRPTKAEQDRLDSVLCLLIALHWRRGAADASMVIGDLQTGYMVTPVSSSVRENLQRSAALRGVPVDDPGHVSPVPSPSSIPSDRAIGSASLLPRHRLPSAGNVRGAHTAGYRLAAEDLRALLVPLARSGRTISYGDVARHFQQPWSRAFSSTLTRALNEVGRENALNREPLLMSLVVNSKSGLPGAGFFAQLVKSQASEAGTKDAHRAMLEQCRNHHWQC